MPRNWKLFIIFISQMSFVEIITQEKEVKKSFKYGNTIHNFLTSNYKWSNATVIYQIDGHFSNRELLAIKQAMKIIRLNSCVRFLERNNEVGYVRITSEEGGCWADTGRTQSVTQLNFGPGCFKNKGTVLHELMHTLGFLHQHTRPDRDQYVHVKYENIIPRPEVLFNFEKIEPWTSLAFPVPYDYDSIMHYTPSMYSKDPKRLVAMVPKNPMVASIGQRDRLSALDIVSINFLYCV